MNIKDIIEDLDSVQMIELKNYLTDELSNICGIKKSNSTIIENNSNVKACSCRCIMSKNGHTKTGVQKYKCLSCSNTCCETTGTVVYHSKLSF